MKKTLKRFIAGTLALVMTAGLITTQAISRTVYAAEDDTVKIFIGSSKTARHHKAFETGETSPEFSYEVNGYTVQSATFESSSPETFKVTDTGAGTCEVKALKEGKGYVILKIKTVSGKELTERVFISVYTPLEEQPVYINGSAGVYMGAVIQGDVENYDNKGTLNKGQQIIITASCEDFYLMRIEDGTTFRDGNNTGFVEKKNITSAAQEITLDRKTAVLTAGETLQFNAVSKPDSSNDNVYKWTTSNSNIATVDGSGKVKGVSEGTVRITVSSEYNEKAEDEAVVSVYRPSTEAGGYINTDAKLYYPADSGFKRGQAVKKDKLTVAGTCGEYFYVKMNDGFAFEDGNTERCCFVEKDKVTIPVASVKLNKTKITKRLGSMVQLNAVTIPEEAGNTAVKWKSSNTDIATVDANGMVTPRKAGTVKITAVAADGNGAEAACIIKVIKLLIPQIEVVTEKFADKKLEVTWKEDADAEGYKIYRKTEEGKPVYLTTIKGKENTKWTDSKIEKGKTYVYYVKSYAYDEDGEYEGLRGQSKKVKINRLLIVGKSDTKARLEWGKISGASGYSVYQYNSTSKKYKCLKSTGKAYAIVTGLKAGKKYKFKVKAYKKNGGKKKYFTVSNKVSAKTYKGKVNGYFGNKIGITKEWDNIVITDKKVSNMNINKYSIEDFKSLTDAFPIVKYNYVTGSKSLYIHLYINIIDESNGGKFEYYKLSGGKYVLDKAKNKSTKRKTYKQLVKDGIKEYWSVKITGSKYDFGKGVDFNTKLVIHEEGEKGCNKKQQYINITIGDRSDDAKMKESKKEYYWYFAKSFSLYDVTKNDIQYKWNIFKNVYMATQKTILLNKYCNSPEANQNNYKNIVAHEIGHCLGLNDSYPKNKVRRSLITNEIGVIGVDRNRAYHIMDNAYGAESNYGDVTGNDVEMILQAQSMAVHGKKNSWQNYKDHKLDNLKHKKSNVIRKKEQL